VTQGKNCFNSQTITTLSAENSIFHGSTLTHILELYKHAVVARRERHVNVLRLRRQWRKASAEALDLLNQLKSVTFVAKVFTFFGLSESSDTKLHKDLSS